MLPTARAPLMVGVNQVIMLSLNMVIIASMIGAGGLGYDVLTALRRLDIGAGVEAGVAIVVLAVALDRLSQAYALRAADATRGAARGADRCRWRRWRPRVGAVAASASSVPAVAVYPERLEVSTSAVLGRGDPLAQRELLRRVRGDQDRVPDQPSAAGPALPGGASPGGGGRWSSASPWLRLGGGRRAAIAGGFCLFIAFTGYWEPAMVSVYLCGVSVVIAAAIGLPVGVAAGLEPAAVAGGADGDRHAADAARRSST